MWCQALSFTRDEELASGKIRWGPSMKTHTWSRQFIWRWLKPRKFTKKRVQVGVDCRVKFCSLHLTAPSHGMVLPLDLGLVACLHLLFAPTFCTYFLHLLFIQIVWGLLCTCFQCRVTRIKQALQTFLWLSPIASYCPPKIIAIQSFAIWS